MSDEQVRVMRLLVEIDYEKQDIDTKIRKHTGEVADLLELMVIKGGVIGKLKVLNEIMSKVKL